MLLELHVKNLALIDSAHVEFGEGLNILTGETGAGKSVIIGSVNMALGQKAPKEMIRQYVREVPGYLREMGYELYRKAYRE